MTSSIDIALCVTLSTDDGLEAPLPQFFYCTACDRSVRFYDAQLHVEAHWHALWAEVDGSNGEAVPT